MLEMNIHTKEENKQTNKRGKTHMKCTKSHTQYRAHTQTNIEMVILHPSLIFMNFSRRIKFQKNGFFVVKYNKKYARREKSKDLYTRTLTLTWTQRDRENRDASNVKRERKKKTMRAYDGKKSKSRCK